METFYADCLNNLQELHNDVEKALEGLPQEALDWSPKKGVNSIAVLTFHIAGSQRYLFGQVIGKQTIQRDRDAEFLVKGLASDELIQRLHENIPYIINILEKLSLADLDSKRIMRNQEVTVSWVMGHTLKHTATHLGHIQVMRDLWDHFKA